MSRKIIQLLTLFAALCIGVAYAQVARVYVQSASSAPIYVYNASSTGKLTPISGSPFKAISGLFIGTNGTHVITLGTDYVHSYKVSSTGAIGAQVSQINTQLYTEDCGPTNGAVLDHSGAYVYVSLNTPPYDTGDCSAFQTFQISSTGVLSFKGSYTFPNGVNSSLPVVAGNDKFALSLAGTWHGGLQYTASFARESTGLLEIGASTEKDPLPPAGWNLYQAVAMTEDPTDHYAVALLQDTVYTNGTFGATQIGSYTGSAAGLSSTNTYENMPTILPATSPDCSCGSDGITGMRMSPSGKLLAVATYWVGPSDDGEYGSGVVLYHFNGAAPPTNFTNTDNSLSGEAILAWDTSNHLYVLNAPDGGFQLPNWELHVYAVTTKVVEVPGSPYTIPGLGGTIVVRSL